MLNCRSFPSAAFLFLIAAYGGFALAAPLRPNVVLILCDDLGYGDVGCYNPAGKIATPNIDSLARDGVRFTDAHSSSAVCTPTRYSLLTGRYNWRTRLQKGVLGGTSPPLIGQETITMAEMLRAAGYRTGCFGKWHLGLGWGRKPDAAAFDDRIEKGPEGWNVDYSQPLADGPLQHGFDRFFGISASLDMVPYAFIDQDRVTEVPDREADFPMSIDKPRSRTRRGPAAAEFEAADVLPRIVDEATRWIEQTTAQEPSAPFFAYVPLASPHTPIVPAQPWQGKSGMNAYADFTMQTDAAVGAILAKLDELSLADHTLVIVTSDNGCSPQADFPRLAEFGHDPSGPLRGTKADIFEGGHRVPYVVRWPAKLPAGGVVDAVIGLQDTMATLADALQINLPPEAAPDSFSWLATVDPNISEQPARRSLVHHSIDGSFAIRKGDWKLCVCPGSGGWSPPRPGAKAAASLPPTQLYNLSEDLSETTNLIDREPKMAAEFLAELEATVAGKRLRAGAITRNDVEVEYPPRGGR